MSTTTINTPHPAPDFRISIFNHPLYRSTTQGWEPFVAAGLYIKQSLSWNDSRSGGIEMSDGKSGAGDVNAIKCAYLRILWRMDFRLMI